MRLGSLPAREQVSVPGSKHTSYPGDAQTSSLLGIMGCLHALFSACSVVPFDTGSKPINIIIILVICCSLQGSWNSAKSPLGRHKLKLPPWEDTNCVDEAV